MSEASAPITARIANGMLAAPAWWRHLPVDLAILALLYFCTARISLLFAFEKTNASPFWPPAGIALAALIIFGGRAWWGILAGAIVANLVTFIGNGFQNVGLMLGLSLLIGLGNASAAALGWLIAGRPRAQTGFILDVRQAMRLLLGAGMAGMAAGLVGASAVTLGGAAPPALWAIILRVWSLGDMIGILVLTPLALAWWCPEPSDPQRRTTWLPYALMCALALVQSATDPHPAWPLWVMAVVPVLALYLHSPRACWTTSLFGIAFLIWQTMHGAGPFAGSDEGRALLHVQLVLLGCGPLLLLAGWLMPVRFQESPDQGLGLLIHDQDGRRPAGLLPALAITAFGMAISFTTWWSLLKDQDARIQQTAANTAANVCEHFTARTHDIMRALQRMASRWGDTGGIPEPLWRKDAINYNRDYGCLQALEWIDRDTVIRWIEPLAGNEAALGMRLSDEAVRRATLENSVRTNRAAITSIVELKQGGAGFVMYMPLLIDGKADGFMVAVFRLGDFLRYLQDTTHAWSNDAHALDIRQGGKVMYSTWTGTDPSSPSSRSHELTLLREPLEVRLTPLAPAIAAQFSTLPGLVLNAGMLLSTLLGLGITLVGIAMAHARQAREASQAKARFLATMSHEIRTPMNGILGAVELILSRPLEQETRAHLELVDQCGRSLLAIINDILDFSKIESGKLELERIPCDVQLLAIETVALLQPIAHHRHLALTCVVAPDLPTVRTDPVRLRQILLNLLSNALKFTSRGCVSLTVSMTSGDGGIAHLRLTCTDTGIGMDDSARARLFTPFTQADASTTRRFGGTGLGLAIVHQLVTLMGGTIRCDSRPGDGTTFTVELDLAITDHAPVASIPPAASAVTVPTPAESPPALAASVTTAAATNGIRILLAEDNLINQRIAAAMLARLGYLVDLVTDGAEAVRQCGLNTYDLVFMDMQMPVMDGLEAARLIRTAEGANRHVPIIALTANAFSEDQSACLAAGMDAFLAKPVRAADLHAMVERFIPRKPSG